MRAPQRPTLKEIRNKISISERKLRDKIAIKAMPSFIEKWGGNLETAAEEAYRMADIMMKKRDDS